MNGISINIPCFTRVPAVGDLGLLIEVRVLLSQPLTTSAVLAVKDLSRGELDTEATLPNFCGADGTDIRGSWSPVVVALRSCSENQHQYRRFKEWMRWNRQFSTLFLEARSPVSSLKRPSNNTALVVLLLNFELDYPANQFFLTSLVDLPPGFRNWTIISKKQHCQVEEGELGFWTLPPSKCSHSCICVLRLPAPGQGLWIIIWVLSFE